ncbi:MAG: glycosyl transferase family protein [Gammaproteobacteria bacterium]|nr:glycosyl transferase family protein [Gammaproteobacteria bacterium]MCF6229953.1 glycosyl transferase family protein [Gammaproteobacteria bacterium]
MSTEHPFAAFIRILGKGKNGSRALTQSEARDAFGMIMRDEIEPEQLGAFLMLLRVKEESSEEIAGFVEAVRDSLSIPRHFSVDLDWSSYAGKRRHLPWFILAVLALAHSGVRIFMHGTSGHTAGRLYTREVLKALELPIAHNWQQVEEQLENDNFSYMDIEQLSPTLHRMIELRPILGLRTPVHTLARQLNPLRAPATLQSIFHPGYQQIHQQAEVLLAEAEMAVIKGDGGEVEVNPDAECRVYKVAHGVACEEQWPACFSRRHVKPAELNIDELKSVWRGHSDNEYAVAAIQMTMAIALKLLGRADSQSAARSLAATYWHKRPLSQL